MTKSFNKLIFIGISITIVIILVILMIIHLLNDNSNNCPKTCPDGYICPPGCINCGPPSPPGPSPSPVPPSPSPSPRPPVPSDIFISNGNYPLISKITSESHNHTCLNSLSEPPVVNNWLPETKDTNSKMSSNYPVGYNYNTNIFVISNQKDISEIAPKLENLGRSCGFPYGAGRSGDAACDIGTFNWTPSTLLFVKKGIYHLGIIFEQISRYLVSIFALVDNVTLSNVNINGNGHFFSDVVQNSFFMTIQNCIIDNNSSNFNFLTSQGTSLVKCKINSPINVGNGSPGYMRDCNLVKNVIAGVGGFGTEQYLFNRCNIQETFVRNPKQYIFGMLNCKGDGVIPSSISCNKSFNNFIKVKTDSKYVNPNVSYQDDSIKNEEFISIDSKGVYKYTETDDSDITKSKNKLYWKYVVMLNQSNINSIEFKKGHCYILPGGNYYINKSITIPSYSIIYGLGFAVLIPTYTTENDSFIIMNDNSYICNCIIYSPAINLSSNIIYLNNYCKLYNTHTRILTARSNLKDNGAMIKVKGDNNYLEHSWVWIADHDFCAPCGPNSGGGACNYIFNNYGINVIGQLNTFVGMFVEHQSVPINIIGNKNKIIWTQGEGDYNKGSNFYLNIGKDVTDLIYVMAGIYAIKVPFTRSAINFEGNPKNINNIANNKIKKFDGISIQDILITGWNTTSGSFSILSTPKGNSKAIPMSPQQVAYICNLSEILTSINK